MQTAASAPEQVREGIEAGAYYYLAKPYQPETLAAIVRAALSAQNTASSAVRAAFAGVNCIEAERSTTRSTTGDTSIGITGQLFEKGEPVQAVAEMNIADNHLRFWNKLIEVANDPFLSSSRRFPSLVFENVVVSGL